MTLFDALVIGGGPAGAAAAALLAKRGWRIALVEKSVFPRRKVCGEFVSATNWPLLERLGVAESFREQAGPSVNRIGLFSGEAAIADILPPGMPGGRAWGRALGREHLDALLLDCAIQNGVAVWQPWTAIELCDLGEHYCCRIISRKDESAREIRSHLVIAAHGSWEPNALALSMQNGHARPRSSDLFGFKAHFRDSELAPDLMPLIAFPGGYGGMVHCDRGRMSFSCCVRRDRLAGCRRTSGCASAAQAVFDHIKDACAGVRGVLARASVEGPWLSVGPLRPGFRGSGHGRLFAIGNAAGEAHPVIAEGISMALQSACLLCGELTTQADPFRSKEALESVRHRFEQLWKKEFAQRLRISMLIAYWAMHPAGVALGKPILRWFPSILSLGARAAGKNQTITDF